MRRLSLLVMVLVCVGFSSATYISMTPSIDVGGVIDGDEAVAELTLINNGDEPAYDVFASLVLGEGLSSDDLAVGILYPGEPYSGAFVINIDENITPGSYSIPVIVDYRDANGHPFSAISSFSLNLKKAVLSKVTLKVDELTLAGAGEKKLMLTVRNLDDLPHSINVKLFLPRELSSDVDERTLFVVKKSSSELSFKLSSFDALPGSSYIVCVVASYEGDGLHYSSYSNGVVHVVEEKPLPSWIPAAVIGFLVLLILLFVIYQFRK
ncbi:MAG: hypothetical protein JW778_07600 [Candidatus Altiarchaeota archaeon]|nr:hypothetical protein [Candidatus Altiarchaeota archaeon]